jgi:hypothetical protein
LRRYSAAERLVVKLGPRWEMPQKLIPKEPEWSLATSGMAV